MKRLIVLLLLVVFWCSFAHADIDTFEGTATSDIDTIEGQTNTDTVEGQTVAAETCGAGTPPLLLWWDMTSTTVGGGSGCSSGDTSAALTGEANIGSGVMNLTDAPSDGNDFYSLSRSGVDIFPAGDFTVEIKINFSTLSDNGLFFKAVSADSQIYIKNETGAGGNDIIIYREKDGAGDVWVTWDVNMSTGTVYYIVVRCSTTAGPDLWISTTKWPDVDTGGSWIEDQNDVLTAWTDADGTVNPGNFSVNNMVGTVDDLKVYGGWKTY